MMFASTCGTVTQVHILFFSIGVFKRVLTYKDDLDLHKKQRGQRSKEKAWTMAFMYLGGMYLHGGEYCISCWILLWRMHIFPGRLHLSDRTHESRSLRVLLPNSTRLLAYKYSNALTCCKLQVNPQFML